MRCSIPTACTGAALLANFFLGGCTTHTPNDITLSSVEAVDLYDKRELGDDLNSGRSHRLLLQVEFTTTTNLMRLAQDKGLSVTSSAYFCDKPEERVILSYVLIFTNGVQVDAPSLSPVQSNRNITDPPSAYYFFTNVQNDGSISTHPTEPEVFHAFDLRHQPLDICFNIRGATGKLSGYESNTVTIPAETIEAALSELTPASR